MVSNIFKPYKTTQENLNKIPYKAGQLIFTTDTKRIYIDNSDAEGGRLLASADSFIDVTLNNDKRTLVFTRLDGTIETISIVVEIDDKLDIYSLNPIQNAAVAEKFNEIIQLIADNKDSLELLIEQNAGFISKHEQAIEELQSNISTNYNETIIGLSIQGQTVTYVKGDGTTHSFTTQDTDTTYSLGTDEVTGLTKLYATVGSAEDGTMTQKAIKTELDKKVGVSVDSTKNILIFTL